ncbi:hypothetical protein EMIT0373P_11227 [Pseudomonas chlororaphis]
MRGGVEGLCQGRCLAGAGVGHGGWLLVTGTLAQGERVSYPIPGKLIGSGKYSRGLRKSGGSAGWSNCTR